MKNWAIEDWKGTTMDADLGETEARSLHSMYMMQFPEDGPFVLIEDCSMLHKKEGSSANAG